MYCTKMKHLPQKLIITQLFISFSTYQCIDSKLESVIVVFVEVKIKTQ